MSRKVVTLSDVAKLSGVSLSTASKVLNGGGRVSPATQRRILAAAEQLDFRPNALAQFFATGRSHTVGVLTTRAPSVFAMPVLLGAQSALGSHGMATLLYSIDFDPAPLDDTVRGLQARRVDGVLVIGDGLARPIHSVASGLSAPVVYALAVSENPEDVSLTPNGRMVGRLATQHLLDIGCRKIVHVTGPVSDLAVREREQGMRDTLAAAGLRPAAPALHGGWTRSWGVQAAEQLIASGRDLDAVFCGNDQVAAGMHMALRAAGRRIPDDVALVGVDNMSGLLRQSDNLITTVDTNLTQVGSAAAEYLMHAETEPVTPGVHYQDCSLVLGESTMGPGDSVLPDGPRCLEI
jgi:LacI family transcriptional regulator